MVNMENYEEYMLLYADNELDAAGKAALEAFLQQHPELREELDMYAAVRFTPDTTLVYEDKEALMKKPATAISLRRSWWAYGAAAGVALVVALLLLHQKEQPAPQFATTTDTLRPATPVRTPSNTIPAPVAPAPENKHSLAQHNAAPRTQTPSARSLQSPVPQQREAADLTATTVAPAAVFEAQPAPIAQADFAPTVAPATVMIADATPEAPRRSSFFARLPLPTAKKQGLRSIKEAVAHTITEAQNVEQNIKETALVVRLGDKEIFTVNF